MSLLHRLHSLVIVLIAAHIIGSIASADSGPANSEGGSPARAGQLRRLDPKLLKKIVNSRVPKAVGKPREAGVSPLSVSSPAEEECLASPIHFFQWVNAKLEGSDCVLETGQYVDVYYFEALAAEQADIHMYENWFDTVLFLANEDGTWTRSDDDSGGNTSARITEKLPETGIYFIIATSFQPAATSPYNLILRGGPGCTYDLTPSNATIPPEGGTFSFFVKTGPRCYYQARAGTMFIDENSITATGEGLSDGEIKYQVTANPRNEERHGGIGIAPVFGTGFSITQLPKICSYTINPASPIILGPFETSGSFSVTSQPGCRWSAFGVFSAQGSSLSGNGTVQYHAYQNNGKEISGAIFIDKTAVEIRQQGLDCTYSFSPRNDRLISARGAEGLLHVETQPDCTWNLTRNQNWIEMQGGGYRGPQTVPFKIGAVTENDDRSGSIQFGYSYGWGSGGFPSISIEQLPTLFTPFSDFDGDAVSDPSVYERSSGRWLSEESYKAVPEQTFGSDDDLPVVGDFDGDGKTDAAVYAIATGLWKLKFSSDAATREVVLGTPGDLPAPADYDGDGKTDIAVYRPSDSLWIIDKSTTGRHEATFGRTGSLPVPADWDKDGKADLAVFHRESAQWELSTSLTGPTTFVFGQPGDYIFAADYGSGFHHPTYYRPSTGEWRIKQIPWEGESTLPVPFVPGAVPVVGDYDGSGAIDPALYEPSTGKWHIRRHDGTLRSLTLGGPGFIPLSGIVHAPPMADDLSIAGRVMTDDGRGLRGAIVTLVMPDGSSRTALTSSLGFFQMDSLKAGEYTIQVSSKRYRFFPMNLSLSGSVSELELVGIE